MSDVDIVNIDAAIVSPDVAIVNINVLTYVSHPQVLPLSTPGDYDWEARE
jgi:hypothetical protein